MRRYVSALVCALMVAFTSSFVVQALPTQSIGTWAPTGTLPGAPTGASVVTLPDGRTLVIGGMLPDGTPTSAVMLYDAELNAMSAVGQLTAARSAHAAAVLKDGRVIVVGGKVNGTTSGEIEIFDPATGASEVVATLTTARSRHAVATLLDGTVLIVGGANGAGAPLAGAEIFTVGGPSTTAAANSMSTARAGLTATTLLDGRVLIVGGNNGSDLASAELYYAESQTFDPVATSLSGSRSGHSAVLLRHNGGVLIAGGSSDTAAQVKTDLFLPPIFPDPFSYGDSTFVATGDLGEARVGAAAGNAVDGYAFAAGGGAQSAEVYRFATVKTDKDDYAPGEYALITGTGWTPNSTVTLLFQEDPAVHADYSFDVATDGDGNFSTDDWAPDWHDLGVRFYLTARDSRSRAQMTFTDNHSMALTAINPTSGSTVGGTLVTITGSGFAPGGQSTYTVEFGTAAELAANIAPSVAGTRVSDTIMTATTPAHAAGLVSVRVKGTSNSGAHSGTFAATLVGSYTYVPPDVIAPTSTIQCNGAACASTFYNANVLVTLAATDNAGGSGVKEIRYTTDGSSPTTASTLYSGVFLVTATTTVKFRAEDNAGNVETVQSQEIKIDKVAPTSTIQCNGATCASTFYNLDVSVTLAATDNAGGSGVKEIRYTTDGSTPTTASTLYSGAFLVTATTTVKFRAEDNAGNVETVQTQEIKIDKVPPTSTIQCNGAACASAYYLVDVSVTLAATDNAGGSGVKEIRYTTDGSNPTAASTLYTAAFLVTATTTVKFRAEDNAGNIEGTKSQTILIDKIDPTVAITSPVNGLNTIATSIAVNGTADDVPSGIASVTVNTVATSYVPATKTWSTNSNVPLNCGANTLTATATDVAGRTGTHAITVTRLCFAFQYLSPLDQSYEGGPVIRNDGKYGRVIPVKGVVSLGGALQTEVDLAAFGLTLLIGVNGVACGGGNATDTLEEYADAGQSSGGTNLFRWTLDQYWIYNLDTKAPPNIAMVINQCYRLDAYVQDASGTRVKTSNSPYVIFRPVR